MAVSAALTSSIKAFIKSAAAGKEGDIVNNKCMKMIAESTKLNKAVAQNELDILFSGVMGKVGGKAKGGLTIDQFVNNFIPEVATKKPKAGTADKIKADIEKASPELHGATKAVKAGAVDRLTDTSKYTGSHKERFDESGKGKGLAGRAEMVDNTGYVGDYKGEGTYDKKVGK